MGGGKPLLRSQSEQKGEGLSGKPLVSAKGGGGGQGITDIHTPHLGARYSPACFVF